MVIPEQWGKEGGTHEKPLVNRNNCPRSHSRENVPFNREGEGSGGKKTPERVDRFARTKLPIAEFTHSNQTKL